MKRVSLLTVTAAERERDPRRREPDGDGNLVLAPDDAMGRLTLTGDVWDIAPAAARLGHEVAVVGDIHENMAEVFLDVLRFRDLFGMPAEFSIIRGAGRHSRVVAFLKVSPRDADACFGEMFAEGDLDGDLKWEGPRFTTCVLTIRWRSLQITSHGSRSDFMWLPEHMHLDEPEAEDEAVAPPAEWLDKSPP